MTDRTARALAPRFVLVALLALLAWGTAASDHVAATPSSAHDAAIVALHVAPDATLSVPHRTDRASANSPADLPGARSGFVARIDTVMPSLGAMSGRPLADTVQARAPPH